MGIFSYLLASALTEYQTNAEIEKENRKNNFIAYIENNLCRIFLSNYILEKITKKKATKSEKDLYDMIKAYGSYAGTLKLFSQYDEMSSREKVEFEDIYSCLIQEFNVLMQPLIDILMENIEPNIKILCIKEKQTIYQDDYGQWILDDWNKEVLYFINNVVFHDIELNEQQYNVLEYIFTQHFHIIQEKQAKYQQKRDTCAPINTGIDFEVYIEDLLINNDFKVKRTPKTGDQGVDLIAIKNNLTVAIQCKYYSKPVGNKAVQEVIAGKGFYMCDFGCVVSNSSFTSSAKKLAQNSNILLLNDIDICEKLNICCSLK